LSIAPHIRLGTGEHEFKLGEHPHFRHTQQPSRGGPVALHRTGTSNLGTQTRNFCMAVRHVLMRVRRGGDSIRLFDGPEATSTEARTGKRWIWTSVVCVCCAICREVFCLRLSILPVSSGHRLTACCCLLSFSSALSYRRMVRPRSCAAMSATRAV